MFAGAHKVDITPRGGVYMEGMIRSHKSTGIHDPLCARAVVLSNDGATEGAFAVVSVDLCLVDDESIAQMKRAITERCGIKPGSIIIAATHTHSGPTTCGGLQPTATEYLPVLRAGVVRAVEESAAAMKPARIGCGHGKEATIGLYRRFMDGNGKVVMIWEQNPAEHDLRVLGKNDPDVGVLKVVEADNPSKAICVLFNHASHPNVMSGDNYLISADYPGVAQRKVEERYGCVGMFINGAQGTVDIDNWKYRDWDGMEAIGGKLAAAVIAAADAAVPAPDAHVVGGSVDYALPARKISDSEHRWAQDILKVTGGKVQPMPDGVGDDYKALLYDKLRKAQDRDIPFQQVCFAIGDTAFLSLQCELFTEIGMAIKAKSPFAHTYLLGLSNGCIGYVPTREADRQGGYEVDTRPVDAAAEDVIVKSSLALLKSVHDRMGSRAAR